MTYVPHPEGAETLAAYRTMEPEVRKDRPFIVAPGDIVASFNAYHQVADLFEQGHTPLTISFSGDTDPVDTHGLGRINSESRIVEYFYPPTINADGLLRDMNIYGTGGQFFDLVNSYGQYGKPFSLSMSEIIKEKSVLASIYDERWIHLGYPQDLQKTLL